MRQKDASEILNLRPTQVRSRFTYGRQMENILWKAKLPPEETEEVREGGGNPSLLEKKSRLLGHFWINYPRSCVSVRQEESFDRAENSHGSHVVR